MSDPVEQIWTRFGQQLAELICHKTDHQDHCHDILQEVYIKMARNIDKIEKADNVLPYLVKIANNTVIDYYRTYQNKAPISEATADPSIIDSSITKPAEDPTTNLAHTFMLELIESLPPLYRHALVRTELEGVSQKQLAEELGISYSGAKSRVQRAKEMIRQSILGCCNYKFDNYGNVISCCGTDCC